MALRSICTACQFGRHEEHQRVVESPPEGGVGGAICDCTGECRERFKNDFEAAQDFLKRNDLVGLALLANRTGKNRAKEAAAARSAQR